MTRDDAHIHDLCDINRETLGFVLEIMVCDCARALVMVGGRRSTTDRRMVVATEAGSDVGTGRVDSVPIDDANGDVVTAEVGVATAVDVDDIVDVGEVWAASVAVRGGMNDGESTTIPGIGSFPLSSCTCKSGGSVKWDC